jgi:hypothetical protein
MVGVPFQTTVAAPEPPFLRASVNAVPGPRDACIETAKVGNATPHEPIGQFLGAPADPEAFG